MTILISAGRFWNALKISPNNVNLEIEKRQISLLRFTFNLNWSGTNKYAIKPNTPYISSNFFRNDLNKTHSRKKICTVFIGFRCV